MAGNLPEIARLHHADILKDYAARVVPGPDPDDERGRLVREASRLSPLEKVLAAYHQAHGLADRVRSGRPDAFHLPVGRIVQDAHDEAAKHLATLQAAATAAALLIEANDKNFGMFAEAAGR